jgi:hypothetical protein
VSQALNCIWVVLALWAFAHWLCRSSRLRSARRVELFGLVCVLALLFPVISENDDLLQQQLWSTPVSTIFKNVTKLQSLCENGTTPEGSAQPALLPGRAAQDLSGNKPAVLLSATFPGATGDRSPPHIS